MYAQQASVVLEDVVFRCNRCLEDARDPQPSLNASLGSTATVRRGLFEGDRINVLSSTGEDTQLEVEDVVVRGCLGDALGNAGAGLFASSGGRIGGSRILIDRARDSGVWVTGDAGVNMSDLVGRDTRATAEGLRGIGLMANGDVGVDVSRAVLEASRTYGCWLDGAETEARIEDVVVLGTRCQESSGTRGVGLYVSNGASATVLRGRFEDSRRAGVLVPENHSEASLTDVVIRGTRSQAGDGRYGWGLQVLTDAAVTLERGLIDDNEEYGINADDPGATLQLTDVTVSNTRSREVDGTFGWGLYSAWTASTWRFAATPSASTCSRRWRATTSSTPSTGC